MKNTNKKVYVGLSGGVDSAVSAYLLKHDGYDVTGVFIKTWQPNYIECTWKNDRLDAMRICAQLDISFKTLDLEKEYKEQVIDYMLSEYKKNNTPNPDIMCNKYIKFDGFLEFARASGARIATGHYAKISQNIPGKNENIFLEIPKDKNKDQTYFLYQIQKENLKDIIFPLSSLEKSEVRKIALDNNLYVADKKESMGICMLGEISIKDFLIKELHPESGDVCNESGKIIGTHDSVILYTIGERHGFEVTKKSKEDNLPHFVYAKDFKKNILYVTQDENKIIQNNNLNNKNSFVLKDLNSFIDLSKINENKIYECMTRYRGDKYKVKLNVESDQINIMPIENLSQKFLAVPGQSAVIYDNDKVILGGVIR